MHKATIPGHQRGRRLLSARSSMAVLLIIILWLTGSDTRAQDSLLKGSTLVVCDDASEWPPYSYWERSSGKKTNKVIGYSVDVLSTILARNGIHHRLTLLPWARCQLELQRGTNYQLALNLSYSAERDKDYFLTRPYYSTTNYYFYSRKKHPEGLKIGGIADLKHYSVCGIHGYNYATYGLAPGEINQGAKTITALIAMLHLGHCDVFVEKHEILIGFGLIGEAYLDDPALGREMIAGMAATPFHMAVSRAMPQAASLKAMLDKELAQMENSGELRKLWRKAISR